MSYITTSGRIIYDPKRPGMTTRNKGWCIIEVDKEITRYYRWWLQYQYHIRLQPPAWDAHISIVRGERLNHQVQSIWKKYDRTIIEFEYEHGNIQKARSGREHDAMIVGDYYYVNIKCPELNVIRSELGLPTGFQYHLTIGRTYEYEARKPKRPIKK